jgi:hypothetical protein
MNCWGLARNREASDASNPRGAPSKMHSDSIAHSGSMSQWTFVYRNVQFANGRILSDGRSTSNGILGLRLGLTTRPEVAFHPLTTRPGVAFHLVRLRSLEAQVDRALRARC